MMARDTRTGRAVRWVIVRVLSYAMRHGAEAVQLSIALERAFKHRSPEWRTGVLAAALDRVDALEAAGRGKV